MTDNPLLGLAQARIAGGPEGITSVCSAHPLVIEAALVSARDAGRPALIEATCNQVNHEGGYTGMRPADFAEVVMSIAEKIGLDLDQIILGGDHLGPNPWKAMPAEEAMQRAEIMVAQYVDTGYTKIHLDASMTCANDGPVLSPDEIARRAARLCRVAEAAARGLGTEPVYVIGTEVPPPGGAVGGTHEIDVTVPEAVEETLRLHQEAFADEGVIHAFDRVIAMVVQPGVEFGHDAVIPYRPERAVDLSATLRRHPNLVFEAHSTDYQTPDALRRLIIDGFAILKVGPWLTHALREALYGLEPGLEALMEELMVTRPRHWMDYYEGSPSEQRQLRHHSLSDRIRYYWGEAEAQVAVDVVLRRKGAKEQVLAAVRSVLAHYEAATAPVSGGKVSDPR